MDLKLMYERLETFTPKPLVPLDASPYMGDIETVMPSKEDADHTVDFAKLNFLNMLDDESQKKAAEATIRQYGVGTCGPRAFYGTTDVHLKLEERLAKFLRVEASIVYSLGFSAISSAIPAYCRRSDHVFLDEHISAAIKMGVDTSRSHIHIYRHCDWKHLDEIAANVAGGRSRFLILEGISGHTGRICPLEAFLAVAERYKMRVFLDESLSLGALGRTGRGLTEHCANPPIEEAADALRARIDLLFGSIEGALGSVGGFCAGSSLFIEHQRLASSGYIFSASLPTYLAQAAVSALDMLWDENAQAISRIADLQQVSLSFHDFLVQMVRDGLIEALESVDPISPRKAVRLTNPKLCEQVWKQCRIRGVHFLPRLPPKNGFIFNMSGALWHQPDRLEYAKKVLHEELGAVGGK